MLQGIYAQSATQVYPIGMRYAEGDWTFRYCRATANLPAKRGARNADTLHEMLDTSAEALEGATTLILTVTGITENQFKDGYINIWTDPTQHYRIESNDATVTTTTTFYLKDPLLATVAAGTDCDLHANIYNNVGTMLGGAPYSSAVCIPLIAITSAYYFWGLTWGPFVGIAHAGSGLGANVNERSVYFANDGSIGLQGDVVGTVDCQQAGFMLGTTLVDDTGTDDIFFMLQLAP